MKVETLLFYIFSSITCLYGNKIAEESRFLPVKWNVTTLFWYHFGTPIHRLNRPQLMDLCENRIFFKNENGLISPFHDIPYKVAGLQNVFNMVVEVPRWSNAKMEISKDDRFNPIVQDTKKGKMRFVANVFPHHGYIWNYGAIPQTWEDPQHTDANTKTKGDNDPIDCLDIGSKRHLSGSVIPYKVLGVMAMIDEGETDWKVIGIDNDDPLANQMNDIGDVEKLMPGLLKATYEWFKYYKVPDGKPENTFAFDGEAKNKEFALNIIEECHTFWQTIKSTSKHITMDSIVLGTAQSEANSFLASQPEKSADSPLPSTVNDVFYIKTN